MIIAKLYMRYNLFYISILTGGVTTYRYHPARATFGDNMNYPAPVSNFLMLFGSASKFRIDFVLIVCFKIKAENSLFSLANRIIELDELNDQ